MRTLQRASEIEWVVKVSKLCNLRCAYCYEYPWLANSEHMSLEQIARLFKNAARLTDTTGHTFVWHGGEPTLLPPNFYASVWDLQREIFGASGQRFRNRIQTNLYRLTSEWLCFFQSGFFASVGVSFDILGNLRSSVAGKDTAAKVAENIDKLKAVGVQPGLLIVLNRQNVAYVDEIFSFCERVGCSFRLLPIYRDAEGRSNDELAVSHDEIVGVLRRLTQLWAVSSSSLTVQPLAGYLANIKRYIRTGRLAHYQKEFDNRVFVVDTNGDMYGSAELYESSYKYINVFSDDIRLLGSSEGWRRSIRESRERMNNCCRECGFFGICDGYYVAEATKRDVDSSKAGFWMCAAARSGHTALTDIVAQLSAE